MRSMNTHWKEDNTKHIQIITGARDVRLLRMYLLTLRPIPPPPLVLVKQRSMIIKYNIYKYKQVPCKKYRYLQLHTDPAPCLLPSPPLRTTLNETNKKQRSNALSFLIPTANLSRLQPASGYWTVEVPSSMLSEWVSLCVGGCGWFSSFFLYQINYNLNYLHGVTPKAASAAAMTCDHLVAGPPP